MKIAIKLAVLNSNVTFVTKKAFCRPLLPAVPLRKLTIFVMTFPSKRSFFIEIVAYSEITLLANSSYHDTEQNLPRHSIFNRDPGVAKTTEGIVAPIHLDPLSIQLEIPEIPVRNQMERTLSARSDRNIWDQL